MPRCPNCFYELVLLEHRRKYKCPKCGKLFPQREIKDKEFVEWNKRRRKEDKEKIKQELKQEKEGKKLSEKEKLARNKQAQSEWREKNREHYNKQKREYWASNYEHLTQKRRENYNKKKPKILSQQKLYRENHKIESRIKYLRDAQKQLALRIFNFNIERALNNKIQNLLPTL